MTTDEAQAVAARDQIWTDIAQWAEDIPAIRSLAYMPESYLPAASLRRLSDTSLEMISRLASIAVLEAITKRQETEVGDDE